MVALLRGINVGGRARLPMTELRSTLVDLGLRDVETYLQSGNVVLESGDRAVTGLAGRIELAIAETFGLQIRVILREREDLVAVARSHPFLDTEADPSRIHVVFLEVVPEADKVAALDPNRSPSDQFEVIGREIYLRYPNGQGRSKLSLDYFERVLGIAGTARNWNTVTKLLEMLS
ncbi:MAG TPA: DUF1697 domain-containing protein [Acidimicrobiia bacterium]